MVMPYLSFNGNCEEAFQWYKRIFDGKIQHLSRYGKMEGIPGTDLEGKVMHAELMLTETGGISGADAVVPVEQSPAVCIHVHLTAEETARKIFASLAEGGHVVGELQKNPPPDDGGISGMVRDRYGFSWIISAYLG